MKRTIATILLNLILLTSFTTYAAPVDYLGGVHNEYEYEEIVFITGEPIKFIGKLKINEKVKEKDNLVIVSYDFDLVPEKGEKGDKLQRKITYETVYTDNSAKGQSIGNTTVTKYSEKIQLNDVDYKLEDYQFSRSDIYDNRPASSYYTGNIKGRKYYSINKNEGQIIVDISGGIVGYENFWGRTETQKVNQTITYPNGKQAVINTETSDSLTRRLVYSDNEVNLISYNGGYVKTTNREVVSKYTYKLPNAKGTYELSKTMNPNLERLIVPKFRDVDGHWAEEYIEKLYSLDVFDDTTNTFFYPEGPITRREFVVALMKACNIDPNIPEQKKSSRRKQPQEVSPFRDISTQDKDYYYIKEAFAQGIAFGKSGNLFKPSEKLTVAEGVTMLIRALGFENRAPNPGYYTSFMDDYAIPYWAKDAAYVSKEIGLVTGTRFNANKALTRAEASQLLVNFLRFLERDLQKDYRENIILFN